MEQLQQRPDSEETLQTASESLTLPSTVTSLLDAVSLKSLKAPLLSNDTAVTRSRGEVSILDLDVMCFRLKIRLRNT